MRSGRAISEIVLRKHECKLSVHAIDIMVVILQLYIFFLLIYRYIVYGVG